MGKIKLFTAADGYEVKDLIQSGIDHLYAAEVLRQTAFSCFDSAGYLAHLGLEVLLKSLLLYARRSFPAEHSLLMLFDQLVVSIPQLAHSLEPYLLSTFEQFNELRYPRPSAPIRIGTEDFLRLESAVPKFLLMTPRGWLAEFFAIEGRLKGGRILMVRKISAL